MEKRKRRLRPCLTDKAYFGLLIPLMLLLILEYAQSVRITNMSVPDIIQYGDQDSVILDCEYETNDTAGLVIKWFFKNKTQPVYQWIPDKKPQDLGILRGKLDLTYKVSHNKHHMHRALRIIEPGTELSGNYTCVVSTFMAEDKRTKKMTVFVPERNFRLTQEKLKDHFVRVVCSAEDMFPQPNISLYASDRRLYGVKTSISPVLGRYMATAYALLQDEMLPSPTQFVCELRIPQANYYVKKEAVYYPGPIYIVPELVTSSDTQTGEYYYNDATSLISNYIAISLFSLMHLL